MVQPIITYVDDAIARAGRSLNELNQQFPLTGNIDMGDYHITGSDPVTDEQYATKHYADQLALDAGAIKN